MPEQPIIIKKKKGHGGHGHHGGSWKVAYADFVTAMMAFFMVMWIMGLSQETKEAIQSYFNDPMGFDSKPRSKSIMAMPATPTARKAQRSRRGGEDDNPMSLDMKDMKRMEEQLRQALANDPDLKSLMEHIKIKITPEGLLIELMETRSAVFFESGSAQIRPQAQLLISRIAPILARSKRVMEVQGHTDAQPFAGDPIGNFRLSALRAISLQQELLRYGVEEDQFASVEGFGPRRLLNPADPYDFSNRRVTILLPREANEGEALNPRDAIEQQMREGAQPEAIDLRPGDPGVAGE